MKLWIFIVLAGCAMAGCGGTSTVPMAASGPKPPNRVVVYYMHRTFRCLSCLWIEKETRRALEESFRSGLASGRLEFHVEDYWMRKDLAERYDVKTVSVVVVNVAEGREVAHQTLDRVWALKGKTTAFHAYVADAVRRALAKTNRSEGSLRVRPPVNRQERR